LIHLLNRKRFQVVPWAAMRFLLAAQKRNTRRLRIEQLLLLALRVLLMLLLVAAMASVAAWAEALWQRWLPAGVAAAPPTGRTHRVVVLDGSFSMGTKRDGRTLFDHARLTAERIIRDAAPGDGFSLVLMGRPAVPIIRNRPHDLNKLLPAVLDPELR